MYPNMNDTPFQEHWLREGTVVFDTSTTLSKPC